MIKQSYTLFTFVHNPKSQKFQFDGEENARLGLVCPAWFGLTVEQATFINYDRPGMIAVGGLAKSFPDPPTGYDFTNAGAMETRFQGITWLQSNFRVRWRWSVEELFCGTRSTVLRRSSMLKG